ncbi:MAG: hypothetical protein EHM72_19785, partial [Calditrichaeota bacterium]
MENITKMPVFKGFASFLLFTFFITSCLTEAGSCWAQEQSNFDTAFNYIKNEVFYGGEIPKTITMLNQMLKTMELTSEQKIEVYKLLGEAHVAQHFETEAVEAINKILELVPNYQPGADA